MLSIIATTTTVSCALFAQKNEDFVFLNGYNLQENLDAIAVSKNEFKKIESGTLPDSCCIKQQKLIKNNLNFIVNIILIKRDELKNEMLFKKNEILFKKLEQEMLFLKNKFCLTTEDKINCNTIYLVLKQTLLQK